MVKRVREENEAPPPRPKKRAHIQAKHVRFADDLPRRYTFAGLQGDGKHSTPAFNPEDDFRLQIENAAKRTPRFLFRFWHSKSGGHAALNTVHKITPKAFLNGEGPKALHKMNRKTIQEIAYLHVGYNTTSRQATVFSSWSQSLALVLTWAQEQIKDFGRQKMHICILDTTKVDASNAILHTQAMHDLSADEKRKCQVFEWEYLIFGVIRTPAFRAVPFTAFESPVATSTTKATVCLPLAHILNEPNVKAKIDMICQIARSYGPALEIPVAAHLMGYAIPASKDHKRRKEYLSLMSTRMPAPEEWKSDRTITVPDVDYHGHKEVFEADKMLRDMVVMQHGPRTSIKAVKPELASKGAKKKVTIPSRPDPDPKVEPEPEPEVEEEIREPTNAEVEKAAASVKDASRLPPVVKTTYQRFAEFFTNLTGYGK